MVNEKQAVQSLSSAIISLANDDNKLNELYSDLLNIREFNKNDSTFNKFLSDPWIIKSDKIDDILKIDGCFEYKKTKNFLALIIQSNTVYLIDKVISSTIKLLQEELGIVTLKIFAAFPLNNEQIDQIKNAIILNKKLLPNNFKKLITEFIVDKNLIGGIKISINSKVIDNSLIGKIQQTKKVNKELTFN